MKIIPLLTSVAMIISFTVACSREQAPTNDSTRFEKWEKEVIETADRTSDSDANAYEIHLYCGHVFNDHKLRKEAIREYHKALAINAKGAAAYASLGLTYEKLGDYDKAIENWEAAKQNGERQAGGIDISVYIDNLKARKQGAGKS